MDSEIDLSSEAVNHEDPKKQATLYKLHHSLYSEKMGGATNPVRHRRPTEMLNFAQSGGPSEYSTIRKGHSSIRKGHGSKDKVKAPKKELISHWEQEPQKKILDKLGQAGYDSGWRLINGWYVLLSGPDGKVLKRTKVVSKLVKEIDAGNEDSVPTPPQSALPLSVSVKEESTSTTRETTGTFNLSIDAGNKDSVPTPPQSALPISVSVKEESTSTTRALGPTKRYESPSLSYGDTRRLSYNCMRRARPPNTDTRSSPRDRSPRRYEPRDRSPRRYDTDTRSAPRDRSPRRYEPRDRSHQCKDFSGWHRGVESSSDLPRFGGPGAARASSTHLGVPAVRWVPQQRLRFYVYIDPTRTGYIIGKNHTTRKQLESEFDCIIVAKDEGGCIQISGYNEDLLNKCAAKIHTMGHSADFTGVHVPIPTIDPVPRSTPVSFNPGCASSFDFGISTVSDNIYSSIGAGSNPVASNIVPLGFGTPVSSIFSSESKAPASTDGYVFANVASDPRLRSPHFFSEW